MISKEYLDKFKAIYKKKFEKELPDDIALDKAVRLLTLVKAVYKPMTKAEFDAVQKDREKDKRKDDHK